MHKSTQGNAVAINLLLDMCSSLANLFEILTVFTCYLASQLLRWQAKANAKVATLQQRGIYLQQQESTDY